LAGRPARSRTTRALWTASFTYLQFGLSIVTGLCLLPLILAHLGRRSYGLWLTGGELLQYLALLDGGVFGLLPWVVAQADGAGDLDAVRRYLANALVVGLAVGLALFGGAYLAWDGLAGWAGLTLSDRRVFQGPLLVLAGAIAVSYPLRIFPALLCGLQDVLFAGGVQVFLSLVGVAISVSLLLAGWGVYAVALAAAVPPALGGLAALARTLILFPELLRGWPWPSWRGVRDLLVQGAGAWVAGFGVQLLAASNGLILTSLGRPEWVAVYACTAKVPGMLQQLAWVMPDSSLVGLAQLHGEGVHRGRVRAVVLRLHQLSFLLAGTGACAVLAANPAFVRSWLGPELFGGLLLNGLLALGLVVSTVIHSTVTTVAVVGGRLQMGLATLLNGGLYMALALPLASRFGLAGLGVALPLAGALTSLAWGLLLQRRMFEISARDLVCRCAWPWAVRLVPALVVTALLGVALERRPLWQVAALALPCGVVYLWWVRDLWADLPIPPRVLGWLARLRLARVGSTRPEPGASAAEPAL
jgi:hypothetical protein